MAQHDTRNHLSCCDQSVIDSDPSYNHTPSPSRRELWPLARIPTAGTEEELQEQLQEHVPLASEQPDDITSPAGLAQTYAQCRARARGPCRPTFLQKHVFFAFMAMFGALAATLEAILFISNRNLGFAPSSNLSYVWTYGPTALFSLAAVIWTYVEYTAKVTSPWLRASTRDTCSLDYLLLDYISMFPLLVPLRALRNHDFLVAAGAFISQLLTILIIAAPSLLKQTLLEIDESVTVKSQFVDDSSRLSGVGLMPLYASIGLKRYDLNYPAGVSEQLVYQAGSPSIEMATELRATVEGLSVHLDCKEALLESSSLKQTAFTGTEDFPFIDATISFTVDLSIADNAMSVSNFVYWNHQEMNGHSSKVFGRVLSGPCTTLFSENQNDMCFAFLFGEMGLATASANNTSKPSWGLLRTTQVICKPSYNIGNFDLSHIMEHAQNLSLSQVPPTRTLGNINDWDFAQAMINAYSTQKVGTLTTNVLGTIRYDELSSILEIDLDDFSTAIMGFRNDLFSDADSVFNASSLASALQAYYYVHSVFLVNTALVTPTTPYVVGHAAIESNRLVVQSLACHFMAANCLLALLILAATIPFFPTNLSFTGDPRTILGIAGLATRIGEKFPQNLSSENNKTLQRMLKDPNCWLEATAIYTTQPDQSSIAFVRHLHKHRPLLISSNNKEFKLYQPLILHTASRVFMCLSLVIIILTLEILRHQSKSNQGVGQVTEPTYLHYLWTVLPVTILSLVGIALSSVDMEHRVIAPYYALSHGPTSVSQSLNLMVSGVPSPQAIYRQIKAANYGGALATAAAMIAPLLTTVSGSLFFESSTYTTTGRLQIVGSFTSHLFYPDYDIIFGVSSGSGLGVNDLGIISTLILESNMSYPAFTYEGLALPAIAWEDQLSGWSNTTELKTEARIPALKSDLSCYQYPQSEILAEIIYVDPNKEPKFGTPEWPAGYRVRVNITEQYCRNGGYNGTVPDLSATAVFFINQTMSSGGVFASGTTSFIREDIIYQSCDTGYFYIWGSFSADDPPIVSASALTCNASISAIDVDAVFFGPELIIREHHPPQPIENSAREIIPANDSKLQFQNSVYQDLYSLPVMGGSLIDPFFSILTTSRYALPISSLADRAQEARVKDAIIFHHNIIVAQTLSATARIGSHQPNITGEYLGVFAQTEQGKINDTYPATIVGNPYNMPSRVLQNEAATWALEVMLATALVLSLLSWAFGPRTGVLPRPPTSIASVLAMLVDGNFFSVWERNEGEPMEIDPSNATKIFGNMRIFQLGAKSDSDHKRPFGIYVIDGNGVLGATFPQREFKDIDVDTPSM